MARRRRGVSRTGLRGAGFRLTALGLIAALSATGCAGTASVGGGPGTVDDPCSLGAPAFETPGSAGFTGEPPADAMEWQESAVVLVEELTALAGDRLGGVWLDWEPERVVVLTLTVGPELPELDAAAAESGVAVDVRYTAAVSRGELIAAIDGVSAEAAAVPGVAGMGADEMNGRLVFQVASGDDRGAATCTRLIEMLADTGVPYAFEVFDGPEESTVRTTVPISEAYDEGAGTLQLSVPSCNGDPEVTSLEESADEVRVEVTSTVPAPGWGGNDCLDLLTVTLEAPLGDRVLVDVTSGATVEVIDASP